MNSPLLSEAARHALEVWREADCLHTKEAVEAAIERLAREITARLAESDPLVLCVMTGGVIPAGMLLPRLLFPLEMDYVHPTRYRGHTEGGELQWKVPPRVPVRDRTVLILDDIFDEGHTLAAVVAWCRGAGARAVHTVVLVDKRHDRKADLAPEFVGLSIPDRYVFGCGMDYRGYWRNAPGIYAVKGL